MWPIVIPAIIGAIAGAVRARRRDDNMLGGAAKGALIGGALGYGGSALAGGMFGGAGGAAGAAGGAGGAGASSSGLMQYLPQIGSFLASNYSPSAGGGAGAGAMSAYTPQTMQDPWGGAAMQMLPSAMGGSIPGAQSATPGMSPTNLSGGLGQLLEMMGQGSGETPKPLGSPEWPHGVAGYGHGDMRKIEGLQMPEIPKQALPSLIAMLARMQ